MNRLELIADILARPPKGRPRGAADTAFPLRSAMERKPDRRRPVRGDWQTIVATAAEGRARAPKR